MTRNPTAILHLDPEDNVAVALSEIPAGVSLGDKGPRTRETIPSGHKLALHPIAAETPVLKYGQIIGFATQDIHPGQWVHTHNLAMGEFARDHAIGRDARMVEKEPPEQRATFQGIVRPDGRVATRNYIGVLATVNCSATVVHAITSAFTGDILRRYPNVDGVVPVSHGTGCAMGLGSEGFQVLQRTLAGYARHPNFGGVLVVGLGCEVNQADTLLESAGLVPGPELQVLGIQASGGTMRTIETGKAAVQQMLETADRVSRQTVSADRLVLGLECGGSDAYSGISANPALGRAVDLLVDHGGTAVLSETPEIYGAEHLLTRRAAREEVGRKLVEKIRWWEEHTRCLGGEINNNPTPGNKAGGLTTILEKSLGAVAKAGKRNLVAVYDYAEPIQARGLVFMDTPGYDPVSVTGMVAGGCNLIAFTTGCGTVCGFKPVPSLKLASNSEMYQRLAADMDINCGEVADGRRSLEEMGEAVFQRILETASGKRTLSEDLGFGDHEFVPWLLGPVM